MNIEELKLKLNRLGKRKWFSTPVINNHYFVVLTNSTNDRQQRLSRRHKRRIETLDNSLRVGDCSSLLLMGFSKQKDANRFDSTYRQSQPQWEHFLIEVLTREQAGVGFNGSKEVLVAPGPAAPVSLQHGGHLFVDPGQGVGGGYPVLILKGETNAISIKGKLQ